MPIPCQQALLQHLLRLAIHAREALRFLTFFQSLGNLLEISKYFPLNVAFGHRPGVKPDILQDHRMRTLE